MGYIAIDTETTGLDPYRGAEVFAWSSCTPEGVTAVQRYSRALRVDPARTRMQAILNSPSEKVCHNFHFDLAMLMKDGYNIPSDTVWHDTLLICQLLNNLEPSNGLDELAYKYGGYPMDQDGPITQAARIYGSYEKIPKRLMEKYQHADAERTMLLFLTFYPKLQQNPKLLADYFHEIELVKSTIRMERRGIMLCRPEAEKLQAWLTDELRSVEEDTDRLVPYAINLNSPKQVIKLLYEDHQWPVVNMNESGMAPATDKDTLELLRGLSQEYSMPQEALDVLDLILRQRSYTKGLGMIQSYLDAADAEDVICPHINTNQARTGRESSENPNMQNISKEAALKTKYPVPARRCFRARPGHVLFLIDYSGIEMRLAVQATGSPRLIALLDADFDFHDACAKSFFGERYLNADKKLKKMLRSAAKNARFAMLYGAGIKQVAKTLGLTIAEAKAGVDRDKADFPEFYDMMVDCIKMARLERSVETFFGRRLYVNPNEAYIATDYLIQGSAAGLFKRAQVRVDHYCRDTWQDRIALWLPVHDELIIEIPRSLFPQRDRILRDIIDLMTSFEEITVNLSAEIKMTTYTWAEAKEYRLAA